MSWFANAGIGALAPLGSLTEAHVGALLDINVKGVIWTVQNALPLMGHGGSIILNASIVASKRQSANWSINSATKAAVRSFARTWSSDLKGRNIRVNAVSPGVIETPGHQKAGIQSAEREQFFAHASSITPLGRVGTDDEVAKVVAFLASDDSGFVTGSEIFADGGSAPDLSLSLSVRLPARLDRHNWKASGTVARRWKNPWRMDRWTMP